MGSATSPDWLVLCRYDAEHLREIAMPVGGIGTGFFCLGGKGQLTDWQLMSRPHRGWRPAYAHLLLWTRQGAERKLRVLEGDLTEGLSADFGAPQSLASLPRMKPKGFEATYPFGRALLEDEYTPVSVAIEAFNPLIPGDTWASSLPMGLLTVTLTNRTAQPLEASVTLLITNFVGFDGVGGDLKGNITEYEQVAGWRGMRFAKAHEQVDPRWGTMVFLSDAADVRVARRWLFRDRPWNGELLCLIDEMLEKGYIADDSPDQPCPPSPQDTWDSSLSVMLRLEPQQAQSVRLLICWHFPYRNLAEIGWWSGTTEDSPIVRNYYATLFRDAADVALQVIPRLEDLRQQTVEFVHRVVQADAPHCFKEAALFNLTALRTHTCFRLEDGTFLGFEGCGSTTGCCHGSCTHVWNYEQATFCLFPDLHRSMIESHLQYGITPSGAHRFRLNLPWNRPTWEGAAADGQMGLIVRCYMQWQREGDEWLKEWYPAIKALMEFCWVPGGWDADRDGVMEGVQHNTYDVEYVGPNPMCTVWYLAALTAMERMASRMGDEPLASLCRQLRQQGSQWVDAHLFNGRYYVQQIQPPQGDIAPMTALSDEYRQPHPRFQVGNGCQIDQLVGQYKANRAGLGDLLDREHIRTALQHIFRYNFRHHFRDHYHNMRTFATADEGGTLICTWPDGDRPEQPTPYWGECMTGYEYQLAVLLQDYGFQEEAEAVVKAVRDRHNGANRNPFNEPECGSYYARSMASWALLEGKLRYAGAVVSSAGQELLPGE
ncbi:MAG: GH116 family glycosyl-hydrolase [Armatimonadota bacterium]|nr:GH116 family glycosyl-hydrolase [Armatimonadota bacterium]